MKCMPGRFAVGEQAAGEEEDVKIGEKGRRRRIGRHDFDIT